MKEFRDYWLFRKMKAKDETELIDRLSTSLKYRRNMLKMEMVLCNKKLKEGIYELPKM